MMACRQVLNEHIRIVLRKTIGRVGCILYLAQSKTLDWESRMRWSVILVFLLSLLFLSRNAVLQISTLHHVDTMSNPAPHFKAQITHHLHQLISFSQNLEHKDMSGKDLFLVFAAAWLCRSCRFHTTIVHGKNRTIALFYWCLFV